MSTTLRNNSESFGLVAWLKQTRVRLPLRAIDVRFEVNDTVADVHLDQVFTNDQAEALDVTYTFPLPAAAAIYRCEMIVDGRVIAAVVEEEVEAKRQFLEAKAAGFKAALVEQHRDNVFSLQLGNVPAGAIVILRVSYLQELERLVDTVRLRIPTCPGVRYIPGKPLLRSNRGAGTIDDTDQVPDASLLSPPRIDSLHPDAAQLSVRGRLMAREADAASFLSPSHPLMARVQEEIIEVSLALDQSVPDQDVMIGWSPRALSTDTVFTTTSTYVGYYTALSRLKGPDTKVERRGPREIWFLIDRSGSMAGRNWEQSCHALQQALDHLHPDDRVGISFFESTVQHFSERIETVARLRADPALRNIVSLGTDGGTELLPALTEVMARWKPSASSVAEQHLVLITDGQVGNDDAILAFARSFPASLHLHALGIDQAVNDAMLLKLSQQSGGRCVFVHPNESIVEAVLAVVNAIEEPVVHGLGVRAPWQAVAFAPKALPRRGETSALLQSNDTHAPVVWFGTLAGGGAWNPRTDTYTSSSPAITLLRVRREIDLLQTRGERAAAIALAKRFNLLCAGACFVAIDRATKGQVAQQHVYQPALEEADMAMGSGVCQSLAAPAPLPPPQAKRMFAQSDESERKISRSRGASKMEKSMIPTEGDLTAWLVLLLRKSKTPKTRLFLQFFIDLIRQLSIRQDLQLNDVSTARVQAATTVIVNSLETGTPIPSRSVSEFIAELTSSLRSASDSALLEPLRQVALGLPPAPATFAPRII